MVKRTSPTKFNGEQAIFMWARCKKLFGSIRVSRSPKCFFIKVVPLIKRNIFCFQKYPLTHSCHAARALGGHLLVPGTVGVVDGHNVSLSSYSPHQTWHFLSLKISSNSLRSCRLGTRGAPFGPWSSWIDRWPKCDFIKVLHIIKPDNFYLKKYPLTRSCHAARALQGHLLVPGAVGLVDGQNVISSKSFASSNLTFFVSKNILLIHSGHAAGALRGHLLVPGVVWVVGGQNVF